MDINLVPTPTSLVDKISIKLDSYLCGLVEKTDDIILDWPQSAEYDQFESIQGSLDELNLTLNSDTHQVVFKNFPAAYRNHIKSTGYFYLMLPKSPGMVQCEITFE